ncbi:hypothetical protein RFI_30044 [Reticulomyxa filosa]|uniref:Uncharacterized protein n=1 Tax=Reticulomyxa filosa TaxID=46433 RepID=X6M1R1_RETFI|nr:hypothetical protein RFI_30044 [Reticulomyxa filosa]|eukprot:ETO07352.1 hypothetical protein RFI_30044 [Reticulomyxa filosa]
MTEYLYETTALEDGPEEEGGEDGEEGDVEDARQTEYEINSDATTSTGSETPSQGREDVLRSGSFKEKGGYDLKGFDGRMMRAASHSYCMSSASLSSWFFTLGSESKKKRALVRIKPGKNGIKQNQTNRRGSGVPNESVQITNLRRADEEYLRPLPTMEGEFRWVVLHVKDLSLISHHHGNSQSLFESISQCILQVSQAHILLLQMKDLLLCLSHSGSKAPITDRTYLSFCIDHIKRYFGLVRYLGESLQHKDIGEILESYRDVKILEAHEQIRVKNVKYESTRKVKKSVNQWELLLNDAKLLKVISTIRKTTTKSAAAMATIGEEDIEIENTNSEPKEKEKKKRRDK